MSMSSGRDNAGMEAAAPPAPPAPAPASTTTAATTSAAAAPSSAAAAAAAAAPVPAALAARGKRGKRRMAAQDRLPLQRPYLRITCTDPADEAELRARLLAIHLRVGQAPDWVPAVVRAAVPAIEAGHTTVVAGGASGDAASAAASATSTAAAAAAPRAADGVSGGSGTGAAAGGASVAGGVATFDDEDRMAGFNVDLRVDAKAAAAAAAAGSSKGLAGTDGGGSARAGRKRAARAAAAAAASVISDATTPAAASEAAGRFTLTTGEGPRGGPSGGVGVPRTTIVASDVEAALRGLIEHIKAGVAPESKATKERWAGDVLWLPLGPAGGAIHLRGRPTAASLAALRRAGATTVVTLQSAREFARGLGATVRAAGMDWLWVPLEGAHVQLIKGRQRGLRNAMRAAAAKVRAGERLVVHCAAGMHRTGFFAYVLQRLFGAPPTDAYLGLWLIRRPTGRGVGDHRVALAESFAAQVLAHPEAEARADGHAAATAGAAGAGVAGTGSGEGKAAEGPAAAPAAPAATPAAAAGTSAAPPAGCVVFDEDGAPEARTDSDADAETAAETAETAETAAAGAEALAMAGGSGPAATRAAILQRKAARRARKLAARSAAKPSAAAHAASTATTTATGAAVVAL